MTRRQRSQVVELLRCAADETFKAQWLPMPNFVDIARQLDMFPFDDTADTNVTIRAWRETMRVWNEGVWTWDVAMLEAAQRLESP